MENKSLNNPSRRRRHQRSNGGNGRNRNRNQNRQGNRGNRRGGSGNRNRNNNRGNRSGNRNRSRRYRAPKQTRFQKILSALTFGLLGQPKYKQPTRRRSQRVENAAQQASQSDQPKKSGSGKKRRVERSPVTSGRLYVGNLDYATTETELEELFRGVGNVLSAEVVTNNRTQQSKGFAFVEMGSVDEAKRAVEILDEKDFMGRNLIISGAKSEGPRDSDGEESSSANSSEEEVDSEPSAVR